MYAEQMRCLFQCCREYKWGGGSPSVDAIKRFFPYCFNGV